MSQPLTNVLGHEAVPGIFVQQQQTPSSSMGVNLASAANSTSLGVGYSGSGFLIFYFVGVTSILQHLGIISNSTRLAGSSGGAAVAAASCAGLQPRQQYEFLLQMADTCRPSGGCRGFLGSVVSQQLHSVLPHNAPQSCSGRLYTAVTAAQPHGLPDPPILLGSTGWQDKEHLVSAVSASCYLPALSGPTATTKLHWKPEAGAVYDGGFSHRLPCSPGVDRCIRVAAQAPVPGVDPVQEMQAFIELLNAGLLNSTQAGALGTEEHTTPYLPLNPDIQFPDSVEIHPGMSGPLPVPAGVWNNFALTVPDEDTLQQLFDVGRRDAAFWVSQQRLARPEEVAAALRATEVGV